MALYSDLSFGWRYEDGIMRTAYTKVQNRIESGNNCVDGQNSVVKGGNLAELVKKLEGTKY